MKQKYIYKCKFKDCGHVAHPRHDRKGFTCGVCGRASDGRKINH